MIEFTAGTAVGGNINIFTTNAKSYYQNNLVAQYDGLENAGRFTHSSTITKWKDLAGSYDAPIATRQIFDNYAYSNGQDRQYLPTITLGESFTIEMCVSSITKTVNWFHLFAASNDNNSLGWSSYNSSTITWKYGSSKPTAAFTGGTISAVATSNSYKLYVGGVLKSTTTGSHLSWSNSQLQWSNPFAANRGTARVHSIRIYNAALSDANISANAAIDRERFGTP